ncbi:MAG: transposase [Planctomycetaceae bacterium]|nr:transposase [Planctomycetaceae bacterium]
MNTPRKFKRCQRFNDQGHAHALTFSCFRQQQFLVKERSCQWLIEAISEAREKHEFHLWAYVIMPEHVHLLIWPTVPDYSISRILTSIKLPVTRRALAYVRQSALDFLPKMHDLQPNGKEAYRFWQRGGGYDRNITEPTTVWSEIEYFHANPVRRKLCERPEDWKYSSAATYAGQNGPITIDMQSLPRTKDG